MEFLNIFFGILYIIGIPIGIIVLSVVWIRGIKNVWGRVGTLLSLLVIWALVFPSLATDGTRVKMMCYQEATIEIARDVYQDLQRGDVTTAKEKLKYFADNQNWDVANSHEKIEALVKAAKCLGKKGASAIGCKSSGL